MTTTPAPLPSPANPALDRFFAALRRSPLVRSQDRVIAGVCTGIAERFGISPVVVRVVAVIATLAGPGLLLYLLAWLFLPDAQGGIRLEKAVRGGHMPSIVLLVVTALAVLPGAGFHAHLGWILPLVAISVVGFFVWGRSSNRGGHAGQHGPWTGQAPWSQATSAQGSSTGPQDTYQK